MHRLLPDFLDALLGLIIALGQNWVKAGGAVLIFIVLIYVAKLLIWMLRKSGE